MGRRFGNSKNITNALSTEWLIHKPTTFNSSSDNVLLILIVGYGLDTGKDFASSYKYVSMRSDDCYCTQERWQPNKTLMCGQTSLRQLAQQVPASWRVGWGGVGGRMGG